MALTNDLGLAGCQPTMAELSPGTSAGGRAITTVVGLHRLPPATG
jgi:hypothetical protein